jgi:hypothetical protein
VPIGFLDNRASGSEPSGFGKGHSAHSGHSNHSGHPAGMGAISRGWSEPTPPVTRNQEPDPGRGRRLQASLRLACRARRIPKEHRVLRLTRMRHGEIGFTRKCDPSSVRSGLFIETTTPWIGQSSVGATPLAICPSPTLDQKPPPRPVCRPSGTGIPSISGNGG